MKVVTTIVANLLLEQSLHEARHLLTLLKLNKGQSEIDIRNAERLVTALESRVNTLNECSFEASSLYTAERQEDIA